jgi:Protein kinase domain
VSRPPAHDSAPPDLPGYRLIRHLGAGGNAQVYLYEQELPHREVAVKVLNESALSEAARRRFTAEANVTAGLAHRHIVQVFDAKVTSDGRPYIVMPYYPQPNLFVRARRAHLSVAEVLRIGIQIGSAVETSHRRGVLHRDIKPQNILTDSYGEPALTDFGIATTKGGDDAEGLSVPWSPPEILYRTGTGDQRSDVYSLGATLWHVLAGRSPFEQPGGDNKPLALMGRIKSDPVPPIGRADVPDGLERLLRQAMAKDPAARPQTAMALIRGLQSVEQELRLPVTQPILPVSDPGDAPDGDTHGTHAGLQSQGQTGSPLWGGAAGDTTIARGFRADGSWAAPARRPATDNGNGARAGRHGGPARPAAWSVPDGVPGDADDPTRARAPRRLDPWGPAPGAHEQPAHAGNPVRTDSWDRMADGGSGGRVRQFPPEAPEAATLARPRAIAPGGGIGVTDTRAPWRTGQDGSGGTHAGGSHASGAGGRGKRKSGRVLALSAGGVLLAVGATVAVFGLGRGGGTPAAAPTVGTQSSSPADAIGQGPGTPTVAVSTIGDQQIEFSWTYAGSAPGDSFRAQVNGGSWTPVSPNKPDLVLSVAQQQQVCILVQVHSADGVNSPPSNQKCWQKS